MTPKDFAKQTPVSISAGHLLVLWDVLANKLVGSKFFDTLGEEEKIALWAAQDLFEHLLDEIGFSSKPAEEWERLMEAARAHARQLPVEYRDSAPSL
jgi:hypothetical protein